MSGTSVEHSCLKALANHSPSSSQAQAGVSSLLLVRRCAERKALEGGDTQVEPGHWLCPKPVRLQTWSPSLFLGHSI